jgi:phage gp29-like protein
MAILDYRGQPVDTGKLTQELAAPSVGGVRQAFFETIASSLTPARLGEIISSVDRGDITSYLTLAEEIEERDLHYRSALSTRKLAVTGLKVTVEAASDDKRDVEIADAVTKLTKSEHFRELLADLMDALGKGFAVSEIMWDKSGKQWSPRTYLHRDPRFFVFDQVTGQELLLLGGDSKAAADASRGTPLDPYKFIVHYPRLKTGIPIRGGLARLACVAFMCKSYGLKDWMTFAEVFGMPLRVGKYGTAATESQKLALLNAVTRIGTDAAAIIPEEMIIEFIESTTSVGGDKLFQGLADWWDRQVSKGILGQTASMEGTPGKLGESAAQDAVREDIRDDDAIKLAATLRRDLIRPFVDLNWGPPKTDYPTIHIGVEETEDLEALGKALTPFIDRGLRVEASVIREKFNLQEPEEGAELLAPASGASLRPSPEQDNDEIPQRTSDSRTTVEHVRVELLRRVLDGAELTHDQRAFLGLAASQQSDEVDDLVEEALDDWRPAMEPIINPILDIVQKASSPAGLKKALKNAKLDADALVQTIATLTFKGRGLGDAGKQ